MPSAEFDFIPSTEDLVFFADNQIDVALSFPLLQSEIPDGLTQRIGHRIRILNNAAVDHSGKTLTVTGLDEEGKKLIETLAAAAASVFVETLNYFKSITSITISATLGGNTVDIGFVDEFVSAPYPLDTFFTRTALGTIISGTIDYDIEYTFSNVFRDIKSNWKWHTETALEGQAGDIAEALKLNVHALRFKANSYSMGATARFEIAQTYN